MLDLVIISITAAIALIFSFITATSVLYLKRKIAPILKGANEMLAARPLEQLNVKLAEMGDVVDEKVDAITTELMWFKKYLSTAPNVMMDHAEGIIDEKMQVLGGHIESVLADVKDEAFEFANVYGKQALAGAAQLLQGQGASILGKQGREKSLANAQIKAAKDQMLKQGIQSQLPEGVTIEMAEQVAQQFGYELEDVQQYLPMLARFLPNLSPGGNGPTQQVSPPRVVASNPSGYKPLGEL